MRIGETFDPIESARLENPPKDVDVRLLVIDDQNQPGGERGYRVLHVMAGEGSGGGRRHGRADSSHLLAHSGQIPWLKSASVCCLT
jgi:hypothetical protein